MRHRRSGVKWACATVAPWALAAGLLVSFTAGAGYDPQAGISAAALTPVGAGLVDAALVPPSTAFASASATLPNLRLDRLIVEARLTVDPPLADASSALDLTPRADLKTTGSAYPAVDRTRKGDPLVALHATLSRRGSDLRHSLGVTASRLIFGRDETLLPPTVLMPGLVHAPDLDAAQALEPWHWDEPTTTRQATSAQSPAAAAAGSTGPGRGPRPAMDGATPSVPRAMALSSTTPAPADATPIEVAAAPVAPSLSIRLDRGGGFGVTTASRSDPDEKPRYADLINPDKLDREQHCLAQAVYFEARSEPEEGQAAVAQVILNRVKSGLYPTSVCGVVFQNRHRYKACQFTFTCEGKSLRIIDPESWQTASRIAKEVLEGKTYLAEVGAATHYHANYVRPSWARRLKKMDVIGRHIFYKLRPGQT